MGPKGDSGGPLMLMDGRGRWNLIGLTSFGPSKCTATESLNAFTRVDMYLDWILETIQWDLLF